MNSASWSLCEWLAWQEGLHPLSIDLGLERLRPVATRLQLATAGLPLISVAGTNGKGSSVACLEQLLLAHGLSCGSYTSPWIHSYNESVRLNGQCLDDAALIEAFERVEAVREGASLTCFEYRTLAAMQLISAASVDVAILEVGLGGRLDAVNLWDADVSLFTTLGLDHQQWLGADLPSVAREKAGIMRRGRTSICADPAMHALLKAEADARGAVLLSAGHDYHFARHDGHWCYHGSGLQLDPLPLPSLAGGHQLANAAGAICAVEVLAPVPALRREAVAEALVRTTLPGRLDYRPGRPALLLDVAHNPQACSVLAHWLDLHPPAGRVVAVCGMYRDKDISGCLSALAPRTSAWHLGTLEPPRGAEAAELERALGGNCRNAHSYETIAAAFEGACGQASAQDLVVVFGSFATVRQVTALLNGADERVWSSI